MSNPTLQRGDFVISARRLDPSGADVPPNTVGVVFEETNAYGDHCGPMVRWYSGGACNVYPGDIFKPPAGYRPATVHLSAQVETLLERVRELEDVLRRNNHRIAIAARQELQDAVERLRKAVPVRHEDNLEAVEP